ncbi:MAG: 3-dehydroquinate synthase [Tidjanibacter sp.]|nr:3-dehydroquinate synthase [Tidjanibacter sp.]
MIDTLSQLQFASQRGQKIVVGPLAQMLPQLLPEGRVVAIVDAEVDALHNLSELLPESVLIPAGEENKNLQLAQMLWEELIDSKVDRDTFLLGVGGGVVSDLVGFVASTYMRGVRFGLVPTTLMGQVDAAIGGKCAVNVGGYKNMVGFFSPAEFVLCDVRLLTTLPEREFRAGVAEIIKSAIVGDEQLFELLENSSLEQLREGGKELAEAVRRAALVKCALVADDPYDRGVRRLLNLGHTMAHAIESLSDQLTHGEAVAVGLVWASQRAVQSGLMSAEVASRIGSLVEKYGLPTSTSLPEEELWEAMTHDKKASGGRVRFVLPRGVGDCVVVEE